jgi:hypothetical protein
MWRNGELVTCDPDGGVPDWSQDPPMASLPGNNHTVYYKLPTRWVSVEVPARQLMMAHIGRWILDQRIDSIRVDSVNNVYNLDFVQEFTSYARGLHRQRWAAQGGATG